MLRGPGGLLISAPSFQSLVSLAEGGQRCLAPTPRPKASQSLSTLGPRSQPGVEGGPGLGPPSPPGPGSGPFWGAVPAEYV